MANKVIIQNDDMTQADIQSSIDDFLKQNSDYSSLYGYKGVDIITELLAGFGSYLAYNNQTLREETYIETVKSVNSIAMHAIDYSYRVNRPSSPKLTLEYNGADAVSIFKGQSFGTYNEMDVIYSGESRSLTTGSTFVVTVGYLTSQTITLDKSKDIWTVELTPETYDYIEDTLISVVAGTTDITVVKRLEDLYLGYAVDFSVGTSGSRLYLYDSNLSLGSDVSGVSSVVVSYLEIPGSFTISTNKLSLSTNYKLSAVSSQGADADDMYYVKSILPFFNQTFRTAVSPQDFNYIIKTFSYFSDAGYQFDNGVPVRYKIRFRNIVVGTIYTLTLYSNSGAYEDNSVSESYEVTAVEGDTYDTMMARMLSIIEAQTQLVEIVYPSVGSILRVQAFKSSSDVQASVSSNLEISEEVINRLADQYLGYIYYTHKQVSQGIAELTYYEQQLFTEFFEPHKLSGSVVALVPATKNGFNLSLNIKILNDDYTNIFNTQWASYIGSYQYTINKSFSVAKALRDIALFTYNGVKYVTQVFSSTNEDYEGYLERYLYINTTANITYDS